MSDICIICGCSRTNLTQCKDLRSWSTLYQAAIIQDHETILAISQNKGAGAEFTLKRDLEKIKAAGNVDHDDDSTRSSKDSVSSSVILPDQCIFLQEIQVQAKHEDKGKIAQRPRVSC